MSSLRASCRTAFTLLEFVLVAAIIAIVGAIAIPRIGRSLENVRADTVARRIVADLAYAQQIARTESRSVTVTFYPSDARTHYKLVGVPHPDHPDQEYDVTLTGEHESIDLAGASFSGTTAVTFDGFGQPDNGGTLLVGNGPARRTIIVNSQTGKATVN